MVGRGLLPYNYVALFYGRIALSYIIAITKIKQVIITSDCLQLAVFCTEKVTGHIGAGAVSSEPRQAEVVFHPFHFIVFHCVFVAAGNQRAFTGRSLIVYFTY